MAKPVLKWKTPIDFTKTKIEATTTILMVKHEGVWPCGTWIADRTPNEKDPSFSTTFNRGKFVGVILGTIGEFVDDEDRRLHYYAFEVITKGTIFTTKYDARAIWDGVNIPYTIKDGLLTQKPLYPEGLIVETLVTHVPTKEVPFLGVEFDCSL